eukprot:scaffold135628_cov33-Tisochrysis_lutea.AAC.2
MRGSPPTSGERWGGGLTFECLRRASCAIRACDFTSTATRALSGPACNKGEENGDHHLPLSTLAQERRSS